MSDQSNIVTDKPVVVNQNVFDTPETQALVESIPTVIKETRAGYKTTEFWVGVVLSLLVVLDGIPLPDKYEGIVASVLGAAYIISRGIAKKGVPDVEVAESNSAPAA